MARAPFQALILLYKIVDDEPVFAVFHRSDWDIWQFVSGGGEDDETPLEAAYRELWEETGIKTVSLYPLDTCTAISASIYGEKHRKSWGPHRYIVMEYSFCGQVTDEEIAISDEHAGFQWMTLEEAKEKLKFDSNRTAAIEVYERLQQGWFPEKE